MSGFIPAYKNYIGTIEYDYEDKIYYGRIAYIDDFVNYHSSIVIDDLIKQFHEAVDDYIEFKKQIEEGKS